MMQLCRPLAQIKIMKVFFLTVGLCNMLDSWLDIFSLDILTFEHTRAFLNRTVFFLGVC